MGISILALGALSLLGYASGVIRLYAWKGASAPGMGMNTAIAFTLTGAALILQAIRKEP